MATKNDTYGSSRRDTVCGSFYFILFFRFSIEGAERVTRSDIQGRLFHRKVGRLFHRKAPEKAMLVLNIITFA